MIAQEGKYRRRNHPDVAAEHNRRLLWIISYHHACNDGTLMALVALIPVLAIVMNLTYYQVGLLGFGILITVIVQYVVGRYADRVFSRYLLEIGAALMGVSFVLMLLVNDFNGLFLAVISMRVGGAFYHPVGTSWITREFSGSYLETALGVQSGVGNFGVILALGTSGFLGDMFTWRAPCLLWAAMNLSAVVLGLTMVHEHEIKTRVKPPTTPRSSGSTLRKMMFLLVPISTGGALYQVTSYFGPINLTRTAHWSPGTADLVFAIWIGVGTLTSYYFGALSSRFGKYRLLVGGYLISIASALVLAATSDWLLISPTLVMFGAFLFVTYPALFSLITDATTEDERGTAFGMLFGFQLGGGALAVYICGIIAESLQSPSYSFVIIAALAALSLATIVLWEEQVRKSSYTH